MTRHAQESASPTSPRSGSAAVVEPNLFGLPGRYYWCEEQFTEDLEKIFSRQWLFGAHQCQVPTPGDYVTLTLGRDSLILARDNDGRIRGFFNSCRHRGSLLCDKSKGRVNRFVCPYHQWTYGLDGSLQQCRLMQDEVDKSVYSLHEFAVEVVEGFIFFCLSENPPDFTPARETFERFFAPHAASPIKPCLELEYSIAANWKTIVDNNRECYHCATGHREFCLSNFDFGMPGDPRSSADFHAAHDDASRTWKQLRLEPGPVSFPDGQWFRCMRFPLKPGFVTESLDGKAVGPIIGDFPAHDIGSLRVVGLPNMWFHLNSDYFMTTRLAPVSAAKTRATVVWYVRADAVEGRDYDPNRVADVWRLTSEQDRKLCEMNQAGLQSTRYVHGTLSRAAEQGVAHFADWYLKKLGERPEAESRKGAGDPWSPEVAGGQLRRDPGAPASGAILQPHSPQPHSRLDARARTR